MTRTALVLAGGGSTGNAWMIGVTAGLLEGGLDVTDTDLMVGTSAGATSAAQLATASSTELFEASLAPVPARVGPVHTQAAADNMARTAAIIAEASDAAEMRRRMGAAAIAIDLYELRHFEPEMKQIVGMAVESARLTAEAMPLLRDISRNSTRIHEITEAMVKLEGGVDDVHAAGLQKAFHTHADAPMKFIVAREIYKHLERIADAFEDVANEIDGIVIDHA